MNSCIKKMLLLATLLALTACKDAHKSKTATESDLLSDLAALHSERLKEYAKATEATSGWPSATDCDATKWAGKACMGGAVVAINLAEYQSGEIHRHPAPETCYDTARVEDVGTTVSRDMMTGYLGCLWERRDLAAMQRMADFGEAHDWIMGLPVTEPRVFLGTNLVGLLGRMIYAVSQGADDRYYRRLFKTYLPVEADYEKDLQAMGIDLQGLVTEELKSYELDVSLELLDVNNMMFTRLQDLVNEHPGDAYFQALLGTYTGDMSAAARLLLDPATPLPTYVRGDNVENYARAQWLSAARAVLRRYQGEQ